MEKDVSVQLTGSEISSDAGHVGKNITVQMTGVEIRSESGRLSWSNVREYWERRPLLLFCVMLLTFSSPFLGLLLAGWVGVVAGLVLSIVSFAGGLFAVTRTREITRAQ
jgi:hypothetical protein